MLEETRLHRIRALLSTLNRVSTEKIIQHLGVSRETVRRDILKLEAIGALRRVHGGIVATTLEPEAPLSVRNTVREKEKQAIARAAVQQLKAGQTLFIDAGSTTSLLADELLSMPGMTVITNSLNVALKLTATETTLHHEVILLGGHMGPSVQATSGDLTISELQRYRADVALLSPVGIASQSGASSFAHHEAAVAGAMVQHAKTRIILADHSKIGITSRVIYATLAEIDVIITDAAAADKADLSSLQSQCRQTIIA
ncbi:MULTISPECIES: DeoR/GlpR family DNA-binding transcription regulator [unclassified Brenneria]|uniref:DeoR/GlpR family DNA-binding transcription regulator n=1 Tax=unclassified Brenneria TaxID=2634434 RepID=UPI001552E6A0|nr:MULTISPECIES: DeoR/GlpR family DNA-binding transcription regulator [unclassified Brenneria]MBJ7221201.1 DeoR/GlpR transcriptional regulator [Brenneria sp. L3-3C-1]MEE3642444.1 DeoR/GlpR family DNA-binding transcription regulator [Brenneria sp. L3_3C_1]MEE3650192.1 DeoR/GlpR family DNA-binding transcription regulator [Brenneria sp. HEZEL_4_2_4]NPD00150.1 DeoR/GlpR transcriptional regulator [Brenneria sp. hezel4-2-4]